MTAQLVIFPGGFPQPSRYQPDPTEALYEEALRTCRREGHLLTEGWADGRSTFECARCHTSWTEDD